MLLVIFFLATDERPDEFVFFLNFFDLGLQTALELVLRLEDIYFLLILAILKNVLGIRLLLTLLFHLVIFVLLNFKWFILGKSAGEFSEISISKLCSSSYCFLSSIRSLTAKINEVRLIFD